MITLRKDLDLIANLVEDNSKVIDIGCGNGELLNYLSKNKNSKIQGLEINQKKEMLIKILAYILKNLLIMLFLVKLSKQHLSLKKS